jgi:putative intracellular protease/amidase/uncharacterized protein (DUF952 family)
MRWIFHLVRDAELCFDSAGRYAPASLATEGFVHGSYREAVPQSARLYFAGGDRPRVLAIDPRRLDVPIDVAETPRGPMPHLRGSIARDAVRVISLDDVERHADVVVGTRIALVAFEGMTLLDLVGPLDAISRIATMGFDETTVCEVIALTAHPRGVVWSAWGAELTAARYRPRLDDVDVLIVPGGHGTRALESDAGALEWIASFPENRLLASVCTGALLLAAAGRLRGVRAITHHTRIADLAQHGAIATEGRVVDDGQRVTAGGVTAGIDLGIHLVRRLAGDDAAARIAAQMEIAGRT